MEEEVNMKNNLENFEVMSDHIWYLMYNYVGNDQWTNEFKWWATQHNTTWIETI